MADNRPMTEEESLRRSHSKFSNFKLTLICLICALCVAVLFASIATYGTEILPTPINIAVTAVSACAAFFSLFLISRFRR